MPTRVVPYNPWKRRSGVISPKNSSDTVDGITMEDEITLNETTTPTPEADKGKVYTKADNKLYFQNGDGDEEEVILDEDVIELNNRIKEILKTYLFLIEISYQT